MGRSRKRVACGGMFFLSWLWALLVRRNRTAKVVILGLDNAGKTTLLHKLKTGLVKSFIPTHRAHVESFAFGNVNFTAWDLGGHEAVRSLWEEYYTEGDALVFVVDSADDERLPEARKELHGVLDSLQE